jgi:flagellar biosynthesis chaperone FliJ
VETTRSGTSIFKLLEVSRHRTLQVLAEDVRDARIFDDHADKDFLRPHSVG